MSSYAQSFLRNMNLQTVSGGVNSIMLDAHTGWGRFIVSGVGEKQRLCGFLPSTLRLMWKNTIANEGVIKNRDGKPIPGLSALNTCTGTLMNASEQERFRFWLMVDWCRWRVILSRAQEFRIRYCAPIVPDVTFVNDEEHLQNVCLCQSFVQKS